MICARISFIYTVISVMMFCIFRSCHPFLRGIPSQLLFLCQQQPSDVVVHQACDHPLPRTPTCDEHLRTGPTDCQLRRFRLALPLSVFASGARTTIRACTATQRRQWGAFTVLFKKGVESFTYGSKDSLLVSPQHANACSLPPNTARR